MKIDTLKQVIEKASFEVIDNDLKDAIDEVYRGLESGEIRSAEKIGDQWIPNNWVKKALLLDFKNRSLELYDDGISHYSDKFRPRFRNSTLADFQRDKIRVTPGAIVRAGSYIGRQVVLLPSVVNVGAYVGDNTMVDSWATVGTCAQIGCNVHLSGGVGIGGTFEPSQDKPTIIEDNCFIGARSEIVEGVIVEEGSVIGMGVFLGQSTPIYDRKNDTISYGRVPRESVVVSGVLNRDKYSLSAAIIVKQVDAKTRSKTSITELLRNC